MKPHRVVAIAATMAVVAGTASACSSSSSNSAGGSSSPSGTSSASASSSSGGSGTETVGISTALSGPVASLGQYSLNGLKLAISDINAHGGLLGKHIQITSADAAATPATGAQNVRDMVSNNHVVALFGPVSSAVAQAELPIATQNKVPIFFDTSNDVSLTTTQFSPYVFQNVPNTVMEPRAIADYLSHQVGSKLITIGTFAPDYSFGHDSVTGFLNGLKALKVNYKLVNQQFPALGASNISANLSALENAHPDYVYNAQYGSDLVTFTKQAQQAGFFSKTKVIGFWGWEELKALGSQAPAGMIAYDRAPFFGISAPALTSFIKEYHTAYNDYPSEWAVLTYAAAQQWAWGVQKAGSFDGTKLSQALAGASPSTIMGDQMIRACDHMTENSEYLGTISATSDANYGAQLWNTPVYVAPFSDIALTCQEAQAQQPSGS